MGHQSSDRQNKVRQRVEHHQLFVMDVTRNVVSLRQCHKAGVRLQKSPLPRTLRECKDVSEYCKTQVADADPMGLNKDSKYSIPWLIRSHVFATLTSMSIPALELDDAKVRDILGSFPDSNGWLMELI